MSSDYSPTGALLKEMIKLCLKSFGRDAEIIEKINAHYKHKDLMVLIYYLKRIFPNDKEHTIHCQVTWHKWDNPGFQGTQKWFSREELFDKEKFLEFFNEGMQVLEPNDQKILLEQLNKGYEKITNRLQIY
ncbi:hypothetical protein [Aeromonas phage AerS_266]|nr:hypothetical protein [Aeromonas phage AerS_266]